MVKPPAFHSAAAEMAAMAVWISATERVRNSFWTT